MFLLVPAYPGSPGQKAVKRLCVCVCVVVAVEQSNQLIVVDESSELVTGIVTQSDILQYLISLKC